VRYLNIYEEAEIISETLQIDTMNGNNFCKWRKSTGRSVADLAALTSISEIELQRWESGKASPLGRQCARLLSNFSFEIQMEAQMHFTNVLFEANELRRRLRAGDSLFDIQVSGLNAGALGHVKKRAA
jgi:transcriptional regulator with XRE-family HTH domain